MQLSQNIIETPELSVVVPVFNEEAVLATLMERILRTSTEVFEDRFEVILVNDGSKDGSWEGICAHADRDGRIVGINLSRNHGHQLALAAGLFHARGAYVFVLDTNHQNPPELLGPMLAQVRGGYDVVFGQRTQRADETASKQGAASFFYRLLGAMIETDIPRDAGDFGLMTRRVVDALNAMPERYRSIRGMVNYVGFNQTVFAYEQDPRFAGETSYPLVKMLALALNAITRLSVVPLRFASHLGMLFGAAGLLAMIWVVVAWMNGRTVNGWASLAVLILIMGSVQLMVIGVFGEYIGRMYMEAKRRPLFIVSEIYRQAPFADHSYDPGEYVEHKMQEA